MDSKHSSRRLTGMPVEARSGHEINICNLSKELTDVTESWNDLDFFQQQEWSGKKLPVKIKKKTSQQE
jgi:hypothetical protein